MNFIFLYEFITLGITFGEVESILKMRSRWQYNGGSKPVGNIKIKKYEVTYLCIDDDFEFPSQWM